jgi:hypothetical protein
VFVTCEGWGSSGRDFRDTEVITVRGGRITEVEVHFGRSLPHEAPP